MTVIFARITAGIRQGSNAYKNLVQVVAHHTVRNAGRRARKWLQEMHWLHWSFAAPIFQPRASQRWHSTFYKTETRGPM